MADLIRLTIDGVEIEAGRGQTILQAADGAGIYIPRLCAMQGLEPFGSCRVCTVIANGRFQAACTQPAVDGMLVENDTERLRSIRRDILEMLLVEGNHFCMFCEKSGSCELQALAYRLGITVPKYPYLWPDRQLDASHGDVFLDRNRCILCGRCVRASRDLDGKHVFDFAGRGASRRIAVNAEADLADTAAAAGDRAMEACPVGALIPKRVGFRVPIGKRLYDIAPIGSDIQPQDPKADGG